ncbi:hypothetical protein MY4824_004545 [Beauveria thailandica]
MHDQQIPKALVKEVHQDPSKATQILNTYGVVDPSPACARALETTIGALRVEGHEIIDNITPPEPYEALQIASQLLDADGVQTAMPFFRTGEGNDRGYWQLIAKCEAYKCRWFDFWEEKGFDFIVAPPNATPAVPHGGMRDACSSCGYTFLFNLLDYTAGLQRPNLNGVARGAYYRHYNADNMHGLPVGVQVIGRRLEEETVLALMKRVEDALGDGKFKLLELDLDGGVEHKFDL